MKAVEAILKLQTDPDIIITAPDCSDTSKLRVYANGGLIGKIYVGNHSNGGSKLISRGYYRYSEGDGNKTKLENIVCRSTDTLKTLVSNEYIEACKYAVEKRFGKKKGDMSDQGEKERHVQTRIVKEFMTRGEDWCVVDMEMQCPQHWFDGNHFSKNTTKQPRFDMIVVNENGIGIIELKVNNDNADNMESHYEHMEFLLRDMRGQGFFIDEIKRRIKILGENMLVNADVANFTLDRVWCGFLFVGGELSKSKELIEPFRGRRCVDDLRFLYYPEYDIRALDMGKMLSFDDFMKQ